MNFGTEYTAIYLNGEKIKAGTRDPLLRLNAVPFDFTDKTVLDLGCNCGGMLYAVAHQIKYGYGLDVSQKAIDAANDIKQKHNVTNVSFQVADLKQYREFKFPKTDIVFMLSIARWVTEWSDVLRAVQPSILVFEAHGDKKQQAGQIRFLMTNYANVAHLLDTHEKLPRSLYLCTDPKLDLLRLHPLEAQCGERLGGGGCRDVYAHKNDPTLVIKVEKNNPSHPNQNKNEFDNWQRLSDNPEQAQWLAPCVELSACHKYLVQRRGTPEPPKAPVDTPAWLSKIPDLHWEKHTQWVKIDDTVKLCDYGWCELPFSPAWLCGDTLSSGKDRVVYAHKTNPEWVVKVEQKKAATPGKNKAEYALWQQIQNTPLKNTVAPCIALYDNGRYLVQARGVKLFVLPSVVAETCADDKRL